MKAPVNYLLEHPAGQIHSNGKKSEVITTGSTRQCVDLRGCLQGSQDPESNETVLQDLISYHCFSMETTFQVERNSGGKKPKFDNRRVLLKQ